MKQLFAIILCTTLLSVNLAGFAAETQQTQPVKVILTKVPLRSVLQDKYAAYKIEYVNEGQNIVRVNDVACYNQITQADTLGAYKFTKSDKVALALSIPTLGFSCLKVLTDHSSKSLEARNEAKKFSADAYPIVANEGIKSRNEVLGTGQSIRFNVLVDLDEKPETAADFEDLVTHKYLRVQSTR